MAHAHTDMLHLIHVFVVPDKPGLGSHLLFELLRFDFLHAVSVSSLDIEIRESRTCSTV